MSICLEISENLQKGKAKIVQELVKKALEEKLTATEILNDGLLAGMNVVGDKFKNNEVYVPDVLVAARAMNKGVELLKPYQVNREVMNNAKPNAIFLHCLPSFHNTGTTIGKEIFEKYGLKEMEVTDEVFESKQSRVFEEAETRMHTIKAVILETLR